MREEILIAAVMIAISVIGSEWKKNDRKWSVVFLLAAAVAGSLVAGMGIRFREIVEGPFGFLDSSLNVVCASVFVWLLYVGGCFDSLFAPITKIKNRVVKSFAVLLFIALPAALTGFTMASVLTTGKIVGDNLKANGMDGKKATTVVVGGSFIGMIMPPNCIPAIIAANGAGSVLPTPYIGFFLPLLLTAVPSCIIFTLMNMKTLSAVTETNREEKSTFSIIIFAAVCILLLVEGLLSSFVYIGGGTLIFTIASILLIVANKGFGSARKCLDTICDGMENAVWPVAFIFALGSFIEVSSMTGVRGLYSLWILPYEVPNVMLVLILASLVIGTFLGEPIPAFLITYAVFPIGWLANTVVVTGCAAGLACVSVLDFRGGLIPRVSKALGTDCKYGDIIKQIIPILVATLCMGLVWVYFGDNLSMLIL